MGGTSNQRLSTFNSTQDCILAGNKDVVSMIFPAEVNTAYCSVWFGHLQNRFDPVVQAQGTAGTAATLNVATTAGLWVGKTVQILGEGTQGCELLDIISLEDATTVIVKSMVRDYGTGAVIGMPASTFGCANPYANSGRWYPTTHSTDDGTAVQTLYYGVYGVTNPQLPYFLHHFSKKCAPGPTYIVNDAAGTAGIVVGFLNKYHLYIKTSAATWDACIYNTTGEYGTSSTASTSTANTLVETGKTWAANQHVNRMVLITAGTNAGQCGKITGNDATSLTIDGTWGTQFGTSRYQICDQLFRTQQYSIFPLMQTRITDTTAPE